MKLFVIILPVCLYSEAESGVYKGPSYPIQASQCLEDIVKNHFIFQYVDRAKLLTFAVSDNLSSPAHEIQENIIKWANTETDWLLIEVASLGERYDFSSYSQCQKKKCRRHFVVNHKSDLYVIVLDNVEDFEEEFGIIANLRSFNPYAYFLIYLEDETCDTETLAGYILRKIWQDLIYFALVLIPHDSHTFNLYILNSTTEGPAECGTQEEIVLMDQCREGRMQQENQSYFADTYQTNYHNCSTGVIAKRYSPFVVNENEGFEIELLKTFAQASNIHLNISLTNTSMESLGSKRNGSWTRSMKLVDEQLYLAVGNLQRDERYLTEFEYTHFYHMEPVVLIVPRAKLVPRWRMFGAIFTLRTWGVCVGSVVLFAFLFFCSDRYLRSSDSCPMEYPLFTSFQVIVGQAVDRQPGPDKDMQRVFFVSLNIFGIILYSLYTCSLVYYLKNPIREHQIVSGAELFDPFGNLKFYIGGIGKYKQLFSNQTGHSQTVYENYQTIDRKKESVRYWVETVGKRDDFVTLASKFYVSYLLANNDNVTTYPGGEPRIFVMKKQLLSYVVSMMMRKGHPLLEELNSFISKLLPGGFVLCWCQKYITQIGKDDATDNMKNDNPFESLTTDHLQGAFAILAIGYVTGFFLLLLEKSFKKFQDVRKDRKRIKFVPRKFN